MPLKRSDSILLSMRLKFKPVGDLFRRSVLLSSESQQKKRRGVSIKRRLRRLSSVFLPHPSSTSNVPLAMELGGALQWNFDAFKLADTTTNGKPLAVLAMFLFGEANLIELLCLNKSKLAAFLERVEAGYDATNPYHNAVHAADVLQRMRSLLMLGRLFPSAVDAHGMLACYLAAIVHDYEHTGRTNAFLVASGNKIAARHGVRSPQEAHHAEAALGLLRRAEYDFLESLPKAQRSTLEATEEQMILATDLQESSRLPERFLAAMQCPASPSDSATSLQGASARPLGPAKTGARLFPARRRHPGTESDPDTRMLTLKMAIKVADLAHLAAPFGVHERWVDALSREFFLQGDNEKTLGLPVSANMDRQKPGILQDQAGFFKAVALPIFKSFAAVFPECQPMYKQAYSNYRVWCKRAAAPGGGDSDGDGGSDTGSDAAAAAGRSASGSSTPTGRALSTPEGSDWSAASS